MKHVISKRYFLTYFLNDHQYKHQLTLQAEILTALRQLGEQLTANELQFLEKHNDISNAFQNVEFVEVKDE